MGLAVLVGTAFPQGLHPDDMGKKREMRERIQGYKSIGPLLTRQLSAAPPGQLQALHRGN